MRPEAILFDLDDTLISYDGASDAAWLEISRGYVEAARPAFGLETMLAALEKQRRWFWDDPERHRIGRQDLFAARREIIRVALLGIGVTDPDVPDRLAGDFTDVQDRLVCLFPGTIDALDRFRREGMRMALITNGTVRLQQAKIDRFGLGPYFEFVQIEEAAGVGKPDPRAYILALDRLRLEARQVWMVGDNLVWDVQGAQRLGIFAVWNDFRGRGLPRDAGIVPDRIVRSIGELLPEGMMPDKNPLYCTP